MTEQLIAVKQTHFETDIVGKIKMTEQLVAVKQSHFVVSALGIVGQASLRLDVKSQRDLTYPAEYSRYFLPLSVRL